MPIEKVEEIKEQLDTVIVLLRGRPEYQIIGILDRVKLLEDYRIANEARWILLDKDTRAWQVTLSEETAAWRYRMNIMMGVLLTFTSLLLLLAIVNRLT